MAKMTDSQGREVCDVEIDGSGCDAFICKANYLTHLNPDGTYSVPDEELDYLTDTYPEFIDDQAFENAVCAAEYAFEGDR